jgi:hypothetical protein
MSLLRYGPVSLNFVKLKQFRKDAVYNGPNYLYTRYTLEVEAIFNPATQEDFVPGLGQPFIGGYPQPPGGPPATLGVPFVPPAATFGDGTGSGLPTPATNTTFPGPAGPRTVTPPLGPRIINAALPMAGAVSAQAVENVLMLPRYALQFSEGGVIVLNSPLPGYPVDSSNGPRPLYAHVTEISGAKTFRVLFGVQTDLNLQSQFTCCDPLVLSHTFSKQHVLDQQWYAKVVTKGRVVFNGPVVARGQVGGNPQEPDDLRSLFIPLTSPGCIRESVDVYAAEDGLTINYVVVDRQLPISWSQSGVVRVEASHTYNTTRANRERLNQEVLFRQNRRHLDMLGRTGADVAKLAGSATELGGTTIAAVIPGSGVSVGDLTKKGIGFAGSTAQAALQLGIEFGQLRRAAELDKQEVDYFGSPVMNHNITIELWGDSTSTRNSLTTFGQRIINSRLGILRTIVGGGLGGYDRTVTHFLADKHIQMSQSVSCGPIAGRDLAARGFLIDGTLIPPFFPNPPLTAPGSADDTGTMLIDDRSTTIPKRIVMPAPSGDSQGSRGSLLVDAIASALEDQGDPNIPVPVDTVRPGVTLQRIASCCPPCSPTAECDPDPAAPCPDCP